MRNRAPPAAGGAWPLLWKQGALPAAGSCALGNEPDKSRLRKPGSLWGGVR